MKKILLIMVMAIFAVSCEKKIEGGITPENYIGTYIDGDLVLKSMPDAETTHALHINFDNVVSYSNTQHIPDKAKTFKQIAERNGDTNFNRTISLAEYYSNTALADNYQSIHAVSNAAWDDKHPAGESLDDIFILKAFTFSDYIRSGYQTTFSNPYGGGYMQQRMFRKPFDQLTIGDIEMLYHGPYSGYYMEISFASIPSIDKEHTITLTMTTTDGKVRTASVKCKPVQFQEPIIP